MKKVEKLALRNLEILNACLTKFESNKFLLIQNSHQFLNNNQAIYWLKHLLCILKVLQYNN
jgi:hypothetical protein